MLDLRLNCLVFFRFIFLLIFFWFFCMFRIDSVITFTLYGSWIIKRKTGHKNAFQREKLVVLLLVVSLLSLELWLFFFFGSVPMKKIIPNCLAHCNIYSYGLIGWDSMCSVFCCSCFWISDLVVGLRTIALNENIAFKVYI